MNDRWDETTVKDGSVDQGTLVERIDLHVRDLEVVREEVRKVEQLISETMQPDRQEGRRLEDLGEAAERLERRVGKWLEQIAQGFSAIKNEVRRNGIVPETADSISEPPEQRRIFLLDDRVLFRKGLKNIFEGRAGYRIVGEATDLEQALIELERAKPDLVIVHVCPEEPSQLGLASTIRSVYPSLKVLVLTERGDGDFFIALIKSGADAYLIDDCSEQRLLYAIGRVLKGETYLSPRISEALVEGWRKGKAEQGKQSLTRREEEILRLVAEGKSSKVIGQELFISAHTVDRHRANIMGKLNIRKAVDLVKYAISRGLVGSDGRNDREE
jgi:DNA-binding NarL/FixJ family response regulator